MSFSKVFLLGVVWLSSGVQAQTYQSVFGQDSTVWNFFYEISDAGANAESKIIGDTTFNSNKYEKLLSYGEWLGYSLLFLREDSSHSRLYVYDAESDSDHLLMDLNLNIGDTIHYLFDAVIVDSIYYLYGAKHLRTNGILYEWPLAATRFEYIEGVGPTSGPNEALDGILLCHSRDGIQNFKFPDSTYGCDFHWIGIDQPKSQEEFRLYPNPSDKEIFVAINMERNLLSDFFISDLTGTIWQKGALTPGTNTISIRQLPSGAYFFQATKQHSLFGRKFFIKL